MDSTNPKRGAASPISRFSVVLVEPQFRDNVGHTARAMLNFGIADLILVRAPPVDEATRGRAVHAQSVLDAARHMDSVADIAKEFDHVVGFAARVSTLDKAHLRYSESLPDVVERLATTPGRVALVFGREDFGLSNEDIAECTMLCTIPTSHHYRSMNLSHAVSVALYAVSQAEGTGARLPQISMAEPHERNLLFTAWWQLTGLLGIKIHKRKQSLMMLRRVIGRSGLTSWEYHRIMGVFSRTLKRDGAWPLKPEDVPDTSTLEATEGPAPKDLEDEGPESP